MRCIKAVYTAEDIIKKSRFIGVLAPCIDTSEIASFLQGLQSGHPNATHIAFAYRLKTSNGFTSRFHDAGEPSGTAGKPIYQYLEGKDLINAVLAVIRYYGGIKLGAGGLARAYGGAAKKVLEIAEFLPYLELVRQEMLLDYKQIQAFEQVLKSLNGVVVAQTFTEQVKLTVELPKAHLEQLIQATTSYNPLSALESILVADKDKR